MQISQIVFRVFRWRDGRYQFTPADAVDYDRENFVPMSTDFILMEGIRMVDEWPIIEKKIPSFDIVFRPVVDPSLIEVGGGAAADAGSVRTAGGGERDRSHPPGGRGGARLPQGGRSAHRPGHHRRDRAPGSSRSAGRSSTS